MKTIIYVVGGIVIISAIALLARFFLMDSEPVPEAQPKPVVVTDTSLAGTVTEVNFEQVAADGPSLISFAVSGGNDVRVIAVPSMGLPQCAAAPTIADPFQIAPGDFIEVLGTVDDRNQIVPCTSAEHYLHAQRTEEKTDVGVAFTYKKGPQGYVLEENTIAANDEVLEVLYSAVFTNTAEYAAFVSASEDREGPQNFQVRVYENDSKLRPAQWVDAYPLESNIEQALTEPSEAIIGGANAVQFSGDGLYPTLTFVTAHGDFMYLISAMYDPASTQIGEDFMTFVGSLKFISTGTDVLPVP